jgi:error-prone DNA polymerase
MNCPNRTNGSSIKVSGLVLVRQRPSTAGGICFITIEDETGVANLVVFEKLFTQYRKEIVYSRFLMVEGKLQKEGEVIHVLVSRCYDLTGLLMPINNIEARATEDQSQDYDMSRYPGAEKVFPAEQDVFYSGRNFH